MNTVVLDPTEAAWRRDWEKHWAYVRQAGWTVVMTDEGGANPLEVLRWDADCTCEMGRGVTYDYRVALERLAKVGAIRGWWVA